VSTWASFCSGAAVAQDGLPSHGQNVRMISDGGKWMQMGLLQEKIQLVFQFSCFSGAMSNFSRAKGPV